MDSVIIDATLVSRIVAVGCVQIAHVRLFESEWPFHLDPPPPSPPPPNIRVSNNEVTRYIFYSFIVVDTHIDDTEWYRRTLVKWSALGRELKSCCLYNDLPGQSL